MKKRFVFYVSLIFCVTNANASCVDPFLIAPKRFEIKGNEIFDSSLKIVWHRCPALYTKGGKCDPKETLPSEINQKTPTVPSWAPKGNWRLPSVSELLSLVAKNCNYQFQSEIIDMPPVPLFTSTMVNGIRQFINEEGLVIDSPPSGNFGWTVFVRDQTSSERVNN